jgi:hypothetical protein
MSDLLEVARGPRWPDRWDGITSIDVAASIPARLVRQRQG